MGFQIIRHETNIDFIGLRKYAYTFSALVILVGVLSLVLKGGPRYGIDFSGGFTVQVRFTQAVELDKLRAALDATALPGLAVQNFGDEDDHEVLIRTAVSEQTANQLRDVLDGALAAEFAENSHEIVRLEMVGPKVGADLREKALQALFYAVLLIATYISGRFEQKWAVSAMMAVSLSAIVYVLDMLHAPMSISIISATVATLVLCVVLRLKYALGSMVALLHDVMIPLGLFSLLNKEIDLTIIAALLTIVGYSLNDTIIIYDRIRENIRAKASISLDEIINMSVNQTLSRTLITSGSTFVAVLALYTLGSPVIQDFSLAVLVGILAGTYSSIYVGAPVLRFFNPKIEEDKASPVASTV